MALVAGVYYHTGGECLILLQLAVEHSLDAVPDCVVGCYLRPCNGIGLESQQQLSDLDPYLCWSC